MMRSLWTAASGMMAQQTSVDTISNNLANVNTVGYKSESTEFKSLLYQNLQAKTTSANGENKPVSAQVGLGSRVVSVTSHYTQGAMNASESSTDFAINGDGFFAVQNENGDTVYTRNGNFYFSTATEGMMLCTADGYPVLSTDGQPIVLTDDYNASKVKVDKEGNIQYPGDDGNLENIGYCVPDKECLYNILIMEEKQDIISCGAGASSKYVFEQGRIERTENVKNLDHYINRIDEMIDRKRKYL